MWLALGHSFCLKEIFHNLKQDKLKLKKQFNSKKRTKLINDIFLYSMELIFNDIIENNVTFVLPTRSRKADIHMHRFTDRVFQRGRKAGKWRDIDYLASYFSGYQMVLTMYNREGKPARQKPIYVDKRFNAKITEKVNQGKQYC